MSAGEGRLFILEQEILIEVVSVLDASKHLNYSPRTIQRWCEEGRIESVFIAGRWFIFVRELSLKR